MLKDQRGLLHISIFIHQRIGRSCIYKHTRTEKQERSKNLK